LKILAFAEQRDSKLKKTAFETASVAARLANQLNAEACAVVIGKGVGKISPELGNYGIKTVYFAEEDELELYSTTAYSKILANVVESLPAEILLLPASSMGKDLGARVAAKLGAGLAADCIALNVNDGTITATRPVYAGKALVDLKINSSKKVFTLRPNVFSIIEKRNNPLANTERIATSLSDSDFTSKVTEVSVARVGRPDLTEAEIIVSGGRGLAGPENFKMIEEVADLLGGAVGASRAVVDAGWRPHDDQVGQTGKTVSPSLYIAVGISGAIQHLAGMSSSKYIVAINKDKEAPIFKVADYGIVGDAFEIVPALTEELKKVLGKN
jgi:electron transfer flavoprotein alpha subunit